MKDEAGKFEKDILDSFENGEWQSMPNLKEEIPRYSSSATATLTVKFRVKQATKKRLETLAHARSKTTSFIAEEALEAYLPVNEWQLNGILDAVNEADSPNAEFADHAEVKAKREAKPA